MKTLVSVLIWLVFSTLAFAQSPEEVQKEAMKEFSWIVGEWEGIAWSQMGPNQRDTFLMHEIISYDLDQTIVDIEGIGKDPSGEVVHHARAVLSFNAQSGKYQWHSWRIPGGLYNEHEPNLTSDGFIWEMENPRGKMRYTTTHTEDDGWFEIGEFSPDGSNWFKFFEMNLTRK